MGELPPRPRLAKSPCAGRSDKTCEMVVGVSAGLTSVPLPAAVDASAAHFPFDEVSKDASPTGRGVAVTSANKNYGDVPTYY